MLLYCRLPFYDGGREPLLPVFRRDKRNGAVLIIGTTIPAFITCRFGFSNLFKYLHPIVGYGGILLLASLLSTRLRRSSASSPVSE